MLSRALGILTLLFFGAFCLSSSANTCSGFDTYTCEHATPNIVHIGGGVSSGQSVGVLLTGNTFSVSSANGSGGSDVIIIAAFASSAPNSTVTPSGTLNGMSFTSLSAFPEGGATNAIINSMRGLNLCGSTCNLSFGYVDLHSALAANGSLSVTINGVPVGTAFYGLVLDSSGQIAFITPNSEAGILSQGTQTVPEPGTLTLLGTGILCLGGALRRTIRCSRWLVQSPFNITES